MSHPGKIVTTEPTDDVWNYENQWNAGLCDCCSNVKKCCCAWFCYPCFLCSLFKRTGDWLCTPVCVPFALMASRAKIRTGFRIHGSICGDCMVTVFCPLCAAVQIDNELDRQGL